MNSQKIEVRSQKSENRGHKLAGKILASSIVILVLAGIIAVCAQLAFAQPGQSIGENQIPLGRDKATAPYLVPQAWGDGSDTGTTYHASTGAATATYTEAVVRFAQNAVTKEWFVTIPSLLPSGSYLGLVRDGAAGAEVNTDTDVAAVIFVWSKELQSLKIVHNDVFVTY